MYRYMIPYVDPIGTGIPIWLDYIHSKFTFWCTVSEAGTSREVVEVKKTQCREGWHCFPAFGGTGDGKALEILILEDKSIVFGKYEI